MSTPAEIIFEDDDGPFVKMYVHYDGHPHTLGRSIQNILSGCQRYGAEQDYPEAFNGMGCLAAWFIGQMKVGWGNFYIVSVDQEGPSVRWRYTISPSRLNYYMMLNVEILVQGGEFASLWRGSMTELVVESLFDNQEVAT